MYDIYLNFFTINETWNQNIIIKPFFVENENLQLTLLLRNKILNSIRKKQWIPTVVLLKILSFKHNKMIFGFKIPQYTYRNTSNNYLYFLVTFWWIVCMFFQTFYWCQMVWFCWPTIRPGPLCLVGRDNQRRKRGPSTPGSPSDWGCHRCQLHIRTTTKSENIHHCQGIQ